MIFNDVLEIKNGRNQRRVENPDGKYPVYGSGGIMGYADDYICSAETVIIGRKGSINNPIFVDEPFWNVDTAFGLEAKREVLIPRYLYYFCKHFDFKQLNKTVTIPSLTKSDLLKIEIKLPCLSNQQSIVHRLQSVEQIIDNYYQQLEKLDELVKARFVEMFGDPVENPHGFRKVALSELAEIKIGPFGSLLHKEDYIEGGHPLLNPSHIVGGKVVPDSKLTISDKKYDELEAYHLHTDDVVMGRRGEMGRCAVVTSEGFLCGTGSLLIRTKGEVTADYIQKTISFPSFRKTIEDMAVGQTMPNLNVPIVSKFQIIKPPIEVQKRYYEFVAQVDKSKIAVQKALDQTQLLFDSLMQKYFG
ncbi:type I restriction modification DNA specificity domain protein [Marvinbryantia formatexigens DSM 14469]|uniref:Type I restriction modification DNA specificity domain protein n=1 Tax=Marvinbryantia formatexigens DSM 14469 TaxID=478749 RepID=C6LMF7_9FIRM|nr:restriction endonuclease subunit S [Marvinbryantia formatexigens]EET58183.1 type I restriction modification DNA specificity domain protein [Marvinbryantia formatexigens DSM 14469]UWO26772.1 restriction endonuclease subunit S [Marvinbryantia formatexigens DSM 14469]